MKACRCTGGEFGFGDDRFRFRVGNAQKRTVLGGGLNDAPPLAASPIAARHRVGVFQ